MAPDKTLGYIVTVNVTTDGTTIVTECRTMKDPQRNATSPTCVIPGDGIDIDVQDLDAEIDDRATHHFLRAVRCTIEPRTGPAKAAHQPSMARAERLLSDAALSAGEAARNEHRRHVVAPLLMLLAIGLLFAAGRWSC